MNLPEWEDRDGNKKSLVCSLPQKGKWEEGLRIYWELHPARKHWGDIVMQDVIPAAPYNYALHKYWSWQVGFYSAGPMRIPCHWLQEDSKQKVRTALRLLGIKPRDEA